MRKQNIFLFLKNDESDQKNISTKLVHSTMNRFLIDEDAQFELIDVFYHHEDDEELNNLIESVSGQEHLVSRLPNIFQKMIEACIIPFQFGLLKYTNYYSTPSIVQQSFRYRIIEAITRAQEFEDEITDTHLIFGASIGFYTLLKQLSITRLRSETFMSSALSIQAYLVWNMINQLKFFACAQKIKESMDIMIFLMFVFQIATKIEPINQNKLFHVLCIMDSTF